MRAAVLERPDTFDRVDRVKWAVGQPILPGDSRLWILGSRLVFDVDGEQHIVPKGFTTDGASIPDIGQVLTGWGPWDCPQRWAAICHDWLYTQPNTPKMFADCVFREVLRSEHATFYQTYIMWLAVALFGGHAYKNDQRAGPMIYDE